MKNEIKCLIDVNTNKNCECDANVSESKSYRYFVQMCDFFSKLNYFLD